MATGAALAGIGCPATNEHSSSAEGGAANAGGAGGGKFVGAGGGSSSGVIEIDPPDVQLDVVVGGAVPTQAFTATLGGTDITDKVTWAYEKPLVGDMDGSDFVPTGEVGGLGHLKALYSDAEGETTVAVRVTHVVDGAGLSVAEKAAFDAPSGPDPSLDFIYPFTGTVMPLRVASPELQWQGGSAGDVYRLKMKSKYYDYTEYFSAPSPGEHTLEQELWEQIEFSGTGPVSDPLELALARKSGATAYEAEALTLHVAQGFVHGAVYYWQLPDQCSGTNFNGEILRIRPDSPVTEPFFNPNGCWGCHTVSRDGKQMAASFADQGFLLQSVDLSQDPAAFGGITAANNIYGTISAQIMAFNDTGSRLIWGDGSVLHVVDTATGASVTPNALGPTCGEPAWSPDGQTIAAHCTGVPSGDGLLTVETNSDGDSFGSMATIVPGGSAGDRPGFPSFTPDSAHLVFGHSLGNTGGPGSLWLVDPDGANKKQLATLDPGGDNRSYHPVVAPKSAGGYHWVVFISRRDYGHKLVGASRQQLWMAAIDDPTDGPDPSHPPFYLRGQELCDKSMNAFYALEPCKEVGEECSSGIDCCEGQCLDNDGDGEYVCDDPGECIQTGNACETAADCCEAVQCYQGFCQDEPPK